MSTNTEQPNVRDATRDLYIDRTRLLDELSEQAMRYAYWNTIFASAKRRLSEAKTHLDIVRAECARDARLSLNVGTTRVTDAAVAAHVDADSRVSEATGQLHLAQFELDVLMGNRDAFFQRKDLLIALVETYRSESTHLNAMAYGSKVAAETTGSVASREVVPNQADLLAQYKVENI